MRLFSTTNNDNKRYYMKRNANLELARLIACLMVIGCHTVLPVFNGNEYELGRVFFQCIFADGVAIFWMLTGCFLFRSTYTRALKSTWHKIAVPLILFSAFCILCFYSNLIDPSIVDGFALKGITWRDIIRNIFCLYNPVPNQNHLWYLWTYIIIIIFLYPFMKAFVDWMDSDKRIERAFIIVSVVMILLNDITMGDFIGAERSNIGKAVLGAVFIIWGHVLYKNRDRFKKKKFVLPAMLIWLLSNSIRSLIQHNIYASFATATNIQFLYWYAGFGVINAIAVIVACMGIGEIKEIPGNVIRYLAGTTFYIYLFHYMIVNYMIAHGYQGRIERWVFTKIPNYYLSELVYMFVIIIVTFAISYVLAIVVEIASSLIKKVVKGLVGTNVG